MPAIVDLLLTRILDFTPIEDTEVWWARERGRAAEEGSIARAALGGLAADRLGWAFASGYRAAFSALLPQLGGETRVSLCATERGGAHPRAIEATLTAQPDGSFVLEGHKRFATMAMHADTLLVIASIGRQGDRNELRTARVDANASGVRRSAMPATPFCPEIEHAEVHLEGVRVAPDDVMQGDAYAALLKPFRTIEDEHVLAAALGHAVRLTREHDLDRALAERAVGLLVGLHAIARESPLDARVHLSLSGLFAMASPLLADLITALSNASRESARAASARLARDLPLLSIASSVRARRTARAWSLVAER